MVATKSPVSKLPASKSPASKRSRTETVSVKQGRPRLDATIDIAPAESHAATTNPLDPVPSPLVPTDEEFDGRIVMSPRT
jgi:hypothetical protein